MSNTPIDPELAAEIETVAAEAIHGDPPSEAVAARLKNDLTALLRKKGHPLAQVWAKSDKGGTEVQMLFPQEEGAPKTVRMKFK